MNDGLRPSYRQIADGWQVSTTAVSQCIEHMVKKGWLDFPADGDGRRQGLIFLKNVNLLTDLDWFELPKVSVVVTTYNRPASLRRLLDCLKQQRQTNPDDLEIIVLNDGSEADYDVASYGDKVNYHYCERHPEGLPQLYSLKNRGVEMAANPIVWLLDDDLVFDDHTLVILRYLHAALKSANPIIIPHYADRSEPHHYQNPFPFICQPIGWDKLAR